MGAFDGLRIPGRVVIERTRVEPPAYLSSDAKYIPAQPSFRLYTGFGVDEFAALIQKAVESNSADVWVPNQKPANGAVRLSTWYAIALLEQLVKEPKCDI